MIIQNGTCPHCDGWHGFPDGLALSLALDQRYMAGYRDGRVEHEEYVRKMRDLIALLALNPESGTAEAGRLQELADECRAYEQANYPVAWVGGMSVHERGCSCDFCRLGKPGV